MVGFLDFRNEYERHFSRVYAKRKKMRNREDAEVAGRSDFERAKSSVKGDNLLYFDQSYLFPCIQQLLKLHIKCLVLWQSMTSVTTNKMTVTVPLH